MAAAQLDHVSALESVAGEIDSGPDNLLYTQ